MLCERTLFIEEVTQKLRTEERTENIIFLDIDGVIYNDAYPDHKEFSEEGLDPEILKILPENGILRALGFDQIGLKNVGSLCQKYGAKLVISSNWRNDLGEELILEQLQTLFQIAGFSHYKSIIGYTPKLDYPNNRGDEIASWLHDNYYKVKSYIILDDNDYGLSKNFGERFIYCAHHLISYQEYFKEADDMLGVSIDENCEAVLQWQGIKNNSNQVKGVFFNIDIIATLRVWLGYDNKKLITELFSLLKFNFHITSISLTHFGNREQDREIFVEKLIDFLSYRGMMLKELFLINNGIENIEGILHAIDGVNVYVKHLSLNMNPIADQRSLIEWVKTYPQPVMLALYEMNNGGKLDVDVIKAAVLNENVTIRTQDDLVEANTKEEIQTLVQAGRIHISEKPRTNECAMS